MATPTIKLPVSVHKDRRMVRVDLHKLSATHPNMKTALELLTEKAHHYLKATHPAYVIGCKNGDVLLGFDELNAVHYRITGPNRTCASWVMLGQGCDLAEQLLSQANSCHGGVAWSMRL